MALDEWLDRPPSSYTSHHFNNCIQEFCLLNSLTEKWKLKHPIASQFSCLLMDPRSHRDLWLNSEEYSELFTDDSISTAPLTGHQERLLEVNSELLKVKDYCRQIRNKK